MATLPQVITDDTFFQWRTRTNEIIDLVNINLVGSPTLMQTMRDIFNYLESAGVFSGCGITDNVNGTVDVAGGEALLRSSDVEGAELFSVVVGAQAALALTDNDLNYVYVDYNAGTPTISATITSSTINNNDICLIAIISRDGNDLTILEATSEIANSHNKMNDMLIETEGFKHVLGGTTITEVGTKQLNVSVGSFYRGLNKYTHAAYDTSAADTFEYYYRDGGSAWTEVPAQNTINTLKYDNNSGVLQNITADYFACQWIYLKIGTSTSELFVFYGQNEYTTISEAQTEAAPTSLPNQLDELGILIGRVIFEQNDASLRIVESAFGNQFTAGQSLAHNNLSGMQGGAQDEYYHLDATEHAAHIAHMTDTNNPHSVTAKQAKADPEGTALAMVIALG